MGLKPYPSALHPIRIFCLFDNRLDGGRPSAKVMHLLAVYDRLCLTVYVRARTDSIWCHVVFVALFIFCSREKDPDLLPAKIGAAYASATQYTEALKFFHLAARYVTSALRCMLMSLHVYSEYFYHTETLKCFHLAAR